MSGTAGMALDVPVFQGKKLCLLNFTYAYVYGLAFADVLL